MNKGKPTIFIVEDNIPIREALKMGLQIEGFAVREAGDGKEALNVLEQSPPPSLILLDLLMPHMNGYEFLECLRRDPANPVAKVPIVVLSAVAGSAGNRLPQVQEILSKPLDFNELLRAIRRHIDTDTMQNSN